MRNGLAHEVPTYELPDLMAVLELPDEAIRKAMSEAIPSVFFGPNNAAWHAMGEEVHARLWENYPRWAKGYIRTLGCSFPVDKEKLKNKSLDWSIGAATPTTLFFDNIVTATQLSIPIGVIPGMHFPYVSDPEAFAAYVVEKTRKYL